MEFVLHLDVAPGTFYDVPQGYFLPTKIIKAQTTVVVDKKLSLSCMFDISLAVVCGETVGFYFTSRFWVQNFGAYLLTALKGKQEATEVDVCVKTEQLVVYHYPNRGTLAISPLVGEEIATIFMEQ